MPWLEIITVRAGEAAGKSLQRRVFDELGAEILRKECVKKMKVYERFKGGVETAVALFWDSEHCDSKGSLLGQHLMATFAEFGPVSHAAWKEVRRPKAVERSDALALS